MYLLILERDINWTQNKTYGKTLKTNYKIFMLNH